MDSFTLTISAGIQAFVGFVVWMAVRRPIDQLSEDNKAMRLEITQLRDNRIAALERHRDENDAKLPKLVPLDFCKEQHREFARVVDKFHGAVVDLAHVQSELKATAAFVSEVNGRVIGLMTDVGAIASLDKRVERLEDK